MRKGQKKRIWTVEQKLEIIHKHLDEHKSVRSLEKEYGAEHGMICRWVKEYIAEGETGLSPKPKSGNKFAALHRKKDLSELEYLRLMVAKQEIEIGWKGERTRLYLSEVGYRDLPLPCRKGR